MWWIGCRRCVRGMSLFVCCSIVACVDERVSMMIGGYNWTVRADGVHVTFRLELVYCWM